MIDSDLVKLLEPQKLWVLKYIRNSIIYEGKIDAK